MGNRVQPPEARAHAQGFRLIAGVDEAGRGPWAGPVVAAAVILTRHRLPVRIDDSKRLTVRQRRRAYEVILRHAEVGVGILSADAIDRHNIRQATLQAMRDAIAGLPIQPDLVLVDGNDPPTCSITCWPIIGGDHLSYPIACASIVAKVLRDSLMVFYHRLFPSYPFHAHKGYGTLAHLQALRSCGPSALHRLSFAPVAALKLSSTVQPDHHSSMTSIQTVHASDPLAAV